MVVDLLPDRPQLVPHSPMRLETEAFFVECVRIALRKDKEDDAIGDLVVHPCLYRGGAEHRQAMVGYDLDPGLAQQQADRLGELDARWVVRVTEEHVSSWRP